MRSIINGKLFDTEKAEVIGNWSYGNWGDFRHFEETLYVTRKGMYVLYGSGGCMSQYSRQTGTNEWSGGSEIRAISKSEAMDWAEEHCSTDEFIQYFGEPEEA